jgi:hypothetical protein
LGVDRSQLTACHWLLLRLAGTAPDDLMAQCRRWLARGRALDVGRAVTYAVLSQRIRLVDPDVDLLAELLAADGADTSALSMVDIVDTDPMPMFGFAPTRLRVDAEMRVAADVIPGRLLTNACPEDDVDRAALAASRSYAVARALWRAWRYPGDGAPWPPPRRVYLVETDTGADLATLAGGLHDALARAGEPYPQVEVYPTREELPSYQRLARAYGALMWTREPDPGVRVADTFDLVDASGPRMTPDHEVLPAERITPLLAYLRAGEPLLVSAVRLDDVVDPSLESAVPMNYRTDGFWVWSEASCYYLERYGLMPDRSLVQHIEERRYVSVPVDGAAFFRALAAWEVSSSDRSIRMYGV